MEKKSLHGLTRGTDLEKMTAMPAQAEARGAILRAAEKGLPQN